MLALLCRYAHMIGKVNYGAALALDFTSKKRWPRLPCYSDARAQFLSGDGNHRHVRGSSIGTSASPMKETTNGAGLSASVQTPYPPPENALR